MEMTVIWGVAPCSLAEIGSRFTGVYCLHHQEGCALVMEAVSAYYTSMNFTTMQGATSHKTVILKILDVHPIIDLQNRDVRINGAFS
jgi:hypothetical protein